MFDTLRKNIITRIVDHLCDIQAKALVHLVQPVIVQVSAELREAVASGRGMTNEEVEARVAELLKPLVEAEEEAIGAHVTAMVKATQIKAVADAATSKEDSSNVQQTMPQQSVPDPATGPTPRDYVRAGYAPANYPPNGYAAKLNDGTLVKDGDAKGLKQAQAEAVAERAAMDAETDKKN